MKLINTILLLMCLVIMGACHNSERRSEGKLVSSDFIKKQVCADVQTKSMPQAINEDSADDPAVWLNTDSVELSVIFGSDKKGGIGAYDLQGNELAYYPVGKINNIDIRQNVRWGAETIDLIAGTNRTTHSITVAQIMKDGSLSFFEDAKLKAKTVGEVYGFSFFYNGETLYAYLNSKEGEVEQWQLSPKGESGIQGEIVRTFDMKAQTEGMVADDDNRIMYLGVERKGIYKFNACPDAPMHGAYILRSKPRRNKYIKSDIEGLAIYKDENCNCYLIASIQGNYSYAVFDLKGSNDYLFSFTIGDNEASSDFIDSVEETDGIEIVSNYMGAQFPAGMLVVHDGYNRNTSGELLPQNYKYIDWRKIETLLNE